MPLDIEIYLHIPAQQEKRRRVGTPVPPFSPPPITELFFAPHGPPTPNPYYVPPPPPPPINIVPLGMQNTIPNLPPPVATHGAYVDVSQWRNKNQSTLISSSWGHIAMFYLVEQMHRWRRFVFRFDRQFDSITALKNIARMYPVSDFS